MPLPRCFDLSGESFYMRFENGWQVTLYADHPPKRTDATDAWAVRLEACNVDRNLCYQEDGLGPEDLVTLLMELQRDDLETRKALTAKPLEGYTLYNALLRAGVPFPEAHERAYGKQ